MSPANENGHPECTPDARQQQSDHHATATSVRVPDATDKTAERAQELRATAAFLGPSYRGPVGPGPNNVIAGRRAWRHLSAVGLLDEIGTAVISRELLDDAGNPPLTDEIIECGPTISVDDRGGVRLTCIGRQCRGRCELSRGTDPQGAA